ncbi:hypothetical protein Leryth_014726 [Lithospermum erythrorhizon]|nr:hypothetical protein Leryth_014726 [Lithospermum erythrorhizon]
MVVLSFQKVANVKYFTLKYVCQTFMSFIQEYIKFIFFLRYLPLIIQLITKMIFLIYSM